MMRSGDHADMGLDGDGFFAILHLLLVPMIGGLAAFTSQHGLDVGFCGGDVLGQVTEITGSWPLAVVLATLLAAGSLLLWRMYPDSGMTRQYNAVAAMGFCALIMHFGGGIGEAHFPFFILTSFLLVYRDWRPIATATAVICLHHLVFFQLQTVGWPVIVFRCLDSRTLMIHLAFGAGQGLLLGYIAELMQQAMLHQRRNAARLQQSEHRFQTLFDFSPDPAWIIAGNQFVDCNAAAVAALGYQHKRDVLNRSPATMSPPVQPDGQPSDVKARHLLESARANGQYRFEWVHLRADQSCFPVEVTLSSLMLDDQPVLYCSWRDMTDHHRAAEQRRLAAIVVENTCEGIVVTAPDGVILSVNPSFTRITGYEADDVIGKRPNILRSNHHDDSFYALLWTTLLQDGHWEGEIWNRRKDGSLYVQRQTITAVRNAVDTVTSYVSVFTDITDLRRSEDRIRHLAYHDALTGLPNRSLLMDRLDNAIGRAKRSGIGIAVMFLDLDRFKAINDTLGHDVGDVLLIETAKRIKSCVRYTDTVARMGGDEFVILMEPCGSSDDVARVAEKLIEQVSQPLTVRDEVISVTTSVGIAVFPQDGPDVTHLLKQADTAMYAAKASGRNAFRFFESQMTEQTLARLHLERDLRQALEGESFELYYQPKFSIHTHHCHGSEALLRWHHPTRGLVSPGDFIPLAEETGLIVPLGDWVLKTACQQIALWQESVPDLLPVSVNVSTRQLFSGDLVQRVLDAAKETGIHLANLQIEITESVVMTDPTRAAEILNALRNHGIGIAIDDFGTGYSSLSYLTKFPIDVIKIDRSFVAGMGDGQQNLEIVNAIISLGQSLGMDVVAEGIETEQEISLLSHANCPVGQGYLFARPMPGYDLLAWLSHTSPEADI